MILFRTPLETFFLPILESGIVIFFPNFLVTSGRWLQHFKSDWLITAWTAEGWGSAHKFLKSSQELLLFWSSHFWKLVSHFERPKFRGSLCLTACLTLCESLCVCPVWTGVCLCVCQCLCVSSLVSNSVREAVPSLCDLVRPCDPVLMTSRAPKMSPNFGKNSALELKVSQKLRITWKNPCLKYLSQSIALT